MPLKKAKTIPKFHSEAAEADWWGTHDIAEIWKHAKPARSVKMPAQQLNFIRGRASSRKQAISIRLDRNQIAAAKKIASHKSVGYQTQLRMWIAEGIRRDAVVE
jgi:predicted DNA binding CopG/RHH family protein